MGFEEVLLRLQEAFEAGAGGRRFGGPPPALKTGLVEGSSQSPEGNPNFKLS